MQTSLHRRKIALFVYFLIPGLALASWVTRTPAIRDAIGASIAQMGMVLTGLSVGSMCGVLLSGYIIKKRGTKFTMLFGLSMVCISLISMAWGVIEGQQPLVGLGLGFFGFGVGTTEIAINMDAAFVEQETGQHVMHTLHGCFSLGTLVGALLGLAANFFDVPVRVHLLGVFVVAVFLLLKFSVPIPGGLGKEDGSAQQTLQLAHAQTSVWRDPRVLMIGFIVFAMALAEGAAYDWLPILLVDEHGFSAALGSMIFVVFAAVMTIGRFAGGVLLKRFGRLVLMRSSIALVVLGVACIALGQSQTLAAWAVVCWGLGAALGFPMALSAAAEGGGQMGERVKAVAIIGYVALLVGPPALGFVGHAFGLRGAMLIVAGLAFTSIFLTSAMRSPRLPLATVAA